ncbi:MAG TPA: phosphoribosyltransferase family protein [Thermomicrobiales bacterium]|nr:phosphoribosyltransferase family protein [Thermomicrobiales bacterium]
MRQIGEFAIDAIYPKRCCGCRRRGRWVCDACREQVALYAPPWCTRCGIPASRGACACRTLPASIDRFRAAGPYDGWIGLAVVAMKYHGEWARAEHLGETLAAPLAFAPLDALVVAMPLHPARLRRRGYNQVDLIAQAAARQTGHRIDPLLRRVRDTPHQVGLDGDARRRNVRDAFAVRDPAKVAGRTVVVVDDVVTTGATVGACANALRRAGAASIWVVSLALEG